MWKSSGIYWNKHICTKQNNFYICSCLNDVFKLTNYLSEYKFKPYLFLRNPFYLLMADICRRSFILIACNCFHILPQNITKNYFLSQHFLSRISFTARMIEISFLFLLSKQINSLNKVFKDKKLLKETKLICQNILKTKLIWKHHYLCFHYWDLCFHYWENLLSRALWLAQQTTHSGFPSKQNASLDNTAGRRVICSNREKWKSAKIKKI